jgi:hypothetical protein
MALRRPSIFRSAAFRHASEIIFPALQLERDNTEVSQKSSIKSRNVCEFQLALV